VYDIIYSKFYEEGFGKSAALVPLLRVPGSRLKLSSDSSTRFCGRALEFLVLAGRELGFQ